MITGNEPAFATASTFDSNGDSRGNGAEGLTIRQYFAAMAMQGILGNPRSAEMIKEQGDETGQEILARASVYAADALIAELNKPKQP